MRDFIISIFRQNEPDISYITYRVPGAFQKIYTEYNILSFSTVSATDVE